jgi:uridine kinase
MSSAPPLKTLLVGLSGASGSGKSYFAEMLKTRLAGQRVIILSQDFYYKEQSHTPFQERQLVNYDHPDAVDFELLIDHLTRLKRGQAVEHPLYDFSQHNRCAETRSVGPAEIVIMDGILIYAVEACRRLFDYRIFVETPLDLCFIRRLRRDMRERGRSVDSVVEQYLSTVRPMYLEFVEPARKFADHVVADEDEISHEIDRVCAFLLDHLVD